MFLHCAGQTTLLWTILLLQDVLGFCEQPSWKRVVWDMTPEDLKQLTKEQANCLHDSTCQICHSFSGMTLSKGCLEILYASCKVALLLVACLSLHYFLPKLKRKKDTKVRLTWQLYREEEDEPSTLIPLAPNLNFLSLIPKPTPRKKKIQTTSSEIIQFSKFEESNNYWFPPLIREMKETLSYFLLATLHH